MTDHPAARRAWATRRPRGRSASLTVTEQWWLFGAFALDLEADFQGLQPSGATTLTGSILANAGYDAFGEPRALIEFSAAGSVAGTQVQNLALKVEADGLAPQTITDVMLGLGDTYTFQLAQGTGSDPFSYLRTSARQTSAVTGERVLEIGVGTGYYSLDLASWLAPGGTMYGRSARCT